MSCECFQSGALSVWRGAVGDRNGIKEGPREEVTLELGLDC